MKSAIEEFCKSAFDSFLKERPPTPAVLWREVDQQSEPPDYYVSLGGIEYAVEISTLMETISVGDTSLPQVGVVASLWSFVDEVKEAAEQVGCLSGTYGVGFLNPIENLSAVRNQIKNDLLDYIRRTQHLNSASEETVFARAGGQRCSIRKIHNLSNAIGKLGPTEVKWEGGAATQICALLSERLDDKRHKLRNVSGPKILLLYDHYRFADPDQFKACAQELSFLTHFHTVFIVRGQTGNFALHSENDRWL